MDKKIQTKLLNVTKAILKLFPLLGKIFIRVLLGPLSILINILISVYSNTTKEINEQ